MMEPRHMTLLQDTRRLLMFFLALGFLALSTDVFLEHYFNAHAIKPAQWIPTLAGPLAAGAAFITAVRFTPATLKLFRVFGVLAILVGSLGMYFHVYATWRALEGFDWQAIIAVLRHAPPLLAPTAFAALGLQGIVLTSDWAVARLVGGTQALQWLPTRAKPVGSPELRAAVFLGELNQQRTEGEQEGAALVATASSEW